MRQGANSAVRFTTYTTLKQSVQSRTRTGQTLPYSVTFAMGAIAGLVTVYTTMPLECVNSTLVLPFRTDCNRLFSLSLPVWSRQECSRSRHAHSTVIPSIARIVSLRRRASVAFGLVRLRDWYG